MSKYNVGDKFIIEIDEVFRNDTDDIIHEEEIYRIKGFRSLVFGDNGLDKLEKLDVIKDKMVRKCVADDYKDKAFKVGYNKGLNDAWELANKLNNMVMQDIINIYGFCLCRDEVFEAITPQEALEKLEAYEKEQAEIKVGDVVFNKDTNEHCVITHIEGKLVVYCLYDDGSCGTSNIKECEKTGKHIDISSILQQIGGAE